MVPKDLRDLVTIPVSQASGVYYAPIIQQPARKLTWKSSA